MVPSQPEHDSAYSFRKDVGMSRLQRWFRWKAAQWKAVATGLVYLQHPYNCIRFGAAELPTTHAEQLREAVRLREIAELEYMFGDEAEVAALLLEHKS